MTNIALQLLTLLIIGGCFAGLFSYLLGILVYRPLWRKLNVWLAYQRQDLAERIAQELSHSHVSTTPQKAPSYEDTLRDHFGR